MALWTGAEFVGAVAARRRGSASPSSGSAGGVRFAFYGRMSTTEFQEPQTSRAWQRAISDELVEGAGEVVVDYFDEGRSRRWSWWDRPAAAALLAAAERPDREFDAIVVGEYERAFEGDQFRRVLGRLTELGVQVWLPEAGGPVELDSPVHQALMVLLGAHARREVARARQRVVAAMRAQARLQGRFLGGRPPYGYRLADAGPHPNAIHARWGRRLQVLEPDPVTAPWVRWMFAQRAAGRSVASLARELNERGVPCPSRVDRARNRHRSGKQWIVRTVAEILDNPRYTGRQVWNRQGSKGHGAGGRAGGRGSGKVSVNPVQEWEVSERLAHVPLVDEAVFVAIQGVRAARLTKDGDRREYALAGLVVCGVCGRRLDAHWVHDRAGYRCRHGYTSGTPRPVGAAGNVYVRQDHLVEALPGLLGDAEPAAAPVSAAEDLRRRGLEIVCGGQRWHLRPAVKPEVVGPLAALGQAALELDWNPTGTETGCRASVVVRNGDALVLRHDDVALL
ncbi:MULTISPECIES: recombinase family protein [unclassified Crossiella]|uniref:recombinase family protein n=1 Tax=unclassified Crossiella TaxID=2620835 RepID=UPI00200025F9|nr:MULTISPECIES: recombinase family protein [unclassified Crossiella]MCK2238985.1 recombinase family protein [Crossiella sp. S99.2]MCK2251446.1 recombinase family protein [Crossiella sp. S99.1]